MEQAVEKMTEKAVRFQSVQARTGRTIVGRLLPGTEIFQGIEAICREHGIKYGFVNCAIGAFKKATFVYPIPNPEATIGIVYSAPVVLEGPMEFLGGQGVICQSEAGNYLIHFHGAVSDKDMHIWGGHFTPGGNIVLATLDLVVSEVEGAHMLRKYDEETGFVQFNPVIAEV